MTRSGWITAAAVAVAILVAVLISWPGERDDIDDDLADVAAQEMERETALAGAGAGPAGAGRLAGDSIARARGVERDREIFRATIARAGEERLDSLPIGRRIVALGRWFVGAEYTPGTLEVDPERLVINLEQFDCVTYIESILALARLLEPGGDPTFDRFRDELRRIRYRGGTIDRYASRLHYFTDWIADNERLGYVRDVTRELGGVPMDEPVEFMSRNPDLYPALESPEVLERIRDVEPALGSRATHYIPKARIRDVQSGIRDGDIIAATSSIRGLDVAHTGFAIWIGGELHFMNAPLVGKTVEISRLPLAERIQRIDGQDGIIVARPLPAR